MPRKKKSEGGFRFCAKKVGLTYSAPVDKDQNPLDVVWFEGKFVDRLRDLHGENLNEYIIGQEAHQNGKMHYHVYMKFYNEFDTSNCRFWDLEEVHPQFINTPGKGFIDYCGKHGVYVSNFWEPDPWSAARDFDSVADGIAHLWAKRPRDMMLHGKQVEENLAAYKKRKFTGKLYFGPYREVKWDHEHKALVLEGDPGMMKTQWAKYWASHFYGSYFYCKNSLDALKYYKGETVIIFDDIQLQERQKYIDACFDVENGGLIPARNKDIEIPPGPRIWLRNPEDPEIPDPKNNIFPNERRAVFIKIEKGNDWY